MCTFCWLAANEEGVTVCLLNDYAPGRPSGPGSRSRGLLVASCASAMDLGGVENELGRDLSGYAPFRLLAMALPAQGVASGRHWRWDGQALREEPLAMPGLVVSSSWRQEEVAAWRVAAWQALAPMPTPAQVRTWQRVHDPSRPAHSPSMWREDAATRSFIHVRVTDESVDMAYEPLRPVPGPEINVTLARRRATAFPAR